MGRKESNQNKTTKMLQANMITNRGVVVQRTSHQDRCITLLVVGIKYSRRLAQWMQWSSSKENWLFLCNLKKKIDKCYPIRRLHKSKCFVFAFVTRCLIGQLHISCNMLCHFNFHWFTQLVANDTVGAINKISLLLTSRGKVASAFETDWGFNIQKYIWGSTASDIRSKPHIFTFIGSN